MFKKVNALFPILLFALVPTFLIWLPFILRLPVFWGIPLPQSGMATIVANYDGPLYLVVAKTLYNLNQIRESFQFPLPLEYYAAHFPLFPALIKIFSSRFNYPYAMLFVTVTSSIAALYYFYKLATDYVKNEDALWLTFIFALFPARWLIVRSVGSPEPLFMAAIIASIYYFKHKKYLLAGVAGAVAQFTKSPAILLFISYAIALTLPFLQQIITSKKPKFRINLRALLLLLIPLSLLGVFYLYGQKSTFGDYLAYFHSGDNIHLLFPPFQIFNYSAPWVGTFWLEEVIFIYLLGAGALVKLLQKKDYPLATFVGIFFVSIIFVSHRDILRYSLPIVPFGLIAFREYLVKSEFKYIFAFLILPIYLFSLAFISQNVMPISNWAPFLL